MQQIRIHGRGGQGVVTTAELLALAAFLDERSAQAFPTFGSERTGAPVVAFCRIADVPIRAHEPVQRPDVVVVQDPTLLDQVPVFEGLAGDGTVVVNSSHRPVTLGLDALGPARQVMTVPATALAREHLGRPLPGAPLLAALVAVTQIVTLESLVAAIRERLAGRHVEGNVAAARAAHELVMGRVGQLEGSVAVARAVAACRPQVVAAYPISPQTHVVEGLARMVRAGELPGCEYLNVESEFGALSVCIGASAMGARTYTATASQGLLYMSEAVFNAAGLGLPIVMTVANRAIGAPINIWNDHSDAMALRDSGWLQLHAASNQEAADLHVQAFVVAEELSLPVMVCLDGFVLTHAHDPVDVPTAEQVDAFLPPFVPRQVLDPGAPVTIGAMVGPEAFTEVRALQHRRMLEALPTVASTAERFETAFGRSAGGLVRPYRLEEAETVVVGMGSAMGAVEDLVDARRAEGDPVGALTISCYRPFPRAALRDALVGCGVDRVVVLDRALSVRCEDGPLGADVRLALADASIAVYDVVAGLGGRPVTGRALQDVLGRAEIDALAPLTFLGLDEARVAQEARTR